MWAYSAVLLFLYGIHNALMLAPDLRPSVKIGNKFGGCREGRGGLGRKWERGSKVLIPAPTNPRSATQHKERTQEVTGLGPGP
jgi:hypothetical protein